MDPTVGRAVLGHSTTLSYGVKEENGMERLLALPMSEVVIFGLTCPDCGWRFYRSLDELERWWHGAERATRKEYEPFCARCRNKVDTMHDNVWLTIGKLFDLWRSPRWREIGLSFVASQQREEKPPENN